jgi:Tol biopolymer transport system component
MARNPPLIVLICLSALPCTCTWTAAQEKPAAVAQDDPVESAHQRVAAKIKRVQERAHQWEAGGRDTSAIARRMEEKVKPLLEAGQFGEAEAELDSVLESLNNDAKSTETSTRPANAPRAIPSAPASAPSREIIVSYADETNKLQLYRMNEDGSARRRITDGTHDCLMPAWSPDGKQIVYLQESENGASIWLCDPDGKDPRMLVASGSNMEPSWLPDSKHIVWFALTPGKAVSSQLNIMNVETLETRPLFSDPKQVTFSNLMPAVSPDGTRVAFVSNRSGSYRIWLSNLDGSDARLVSPLSADLDERLQLPIEQKVPSWSQDGRWIAHWEGVEMDHMSKFTGKPDREKDALIERSWNVWIVGSDGKNKRKAGHGDDPNWSPDGFVTRAFPDPTRGGPNVMIATKDGWRELPIIPPKTPRYGRFTWKP